MLTLSLVGSYGAHFPFLHITGLGGVGVGDGVGASIFDGDVTSGIMGVSADGLTSGTEEGSM